jgi:putative ABC transport system substrate-binding protein
MGFVEGRNVAIEYRWAEGQYDRLPAMAAELVRRRVTVIMASGGNSGVPAAKAATSTIPIVFTAPGDPTASGLVQSLNHPGGNVTGVNFFLSETWTKLLGLVHELVPAASNIGVLLKSDTQTSAVIAEELPAAERSLGLHLRGLKAGTERDIENVLAELAQQRPDALMVQSGPFMSDYFDRIVAQATRLSLPTISGVRRFAQLGGLMSYGASVTDAYHQAGLYVGRILKGEKPADIPVWQSTKFELVINLKTAKALGLTVPPTLLALADEVIE